MAAKTTSQKADRKRTSKKSKVISKAGPPAVAYASARKVVAQNLINMVIVAAGSGTVLVGLLAVRHF